MTIRIRLQRTKGWRLPVGAVRIDRRTAWGNPFLPPRAPGETPGVLGMHGDRLETPAPLTTDEAVACYRAWVARRWHVLERLIGVDAAILAQHLGAPPSVEEVSRLRGLALACWCAADGACHADVLIEIANGPACEAVRAEAA